MSQSGSFPAKSLASLLPKGRVATVDIKVNSLAVDSRLVTPGTLFIACPGLSVDGRNFIDQAVASGAVAVVAESEGAEIGDISVPVILIEGLAEQVSAIAGRFYGEPSTQMKITGFTGTNGKTTCTQLLAQLYQLLGESAGVIGTLGFGQVAARKDGKDGDLVEPSLTETGMTTPDALQTQKILAEFHAGGVNSVAMEVSSHSLDQGRVADVQFDTAVFTNLSRDHLDYHGTVESYAAAKATLFEQDGLSLAVVNGDDEQALSVLATLPESVQGYQFSLQNPAADIYASNIALSASGISAQLHTPWGDAHLSSGLLGEFNLSNLLAVIAVACGQGFDLRQVVAAVARLSPVAGRMEVVSAGSQPAVVVDFAHTPDGLEQALRAMAELTEGDLWCVFGCGGDRDRGKRKVMAEVASGYASHIVVTSDNPRSEDPQRIIADILQGVSDQADVAVQVDRQLAIAYAIAAADERDSILIAGKGHEQYQLVAGQKLPFCDVQAARDALSQRVEGGAQ